MQDDDLAGMMRALGHPARVQILRQLVSPAPQRCCMDLAQCLPLAQSTVSQHIKVLLDAGLLERHPDGTRNRYSVRRDRLQALTEAFGALLSAPRPATMLPDQAQPETE